MAQQNITIEMATWIVEHGSQYLKDLAATGHPVRRQYAMERAKVDYPDFTPDFDGKAKWRELSDDDPSPSVRQLALVRQYGGRAVLLSHNTRGDALCYNRVAVVIANSSLGVPLVEANKNY